MIYCHICCDHVLFFRHDSSFLFCSSFVIILSPHLPSFVLWTLCLFSCPSSFLSFFTPRPPLSSSSSSSSSLNPLLFITINNMRLPLALKQLCSLSSPGSRLWALTWAWSTWKLPPSTKTIQTYHKIPGNVQIHVVFQKKKTGLPFFLFLFLFSPLMSWSRFCFLFRKALKCSGFTSLQAVPEVTWWQDWGKRGKVGQF